MAQLASTGEGQSRWRVAPAAAPRSGQRRGVVRLVARRDRLRGGALANGGGSARPAVSRVAPVRPRPSRRRLAPPSGRRRRVIWGRWRRSCWTAPGPLRRLDTAFATRLRRRRRSSRAPSAAARSWPPPAEPFRSLVGDPADEVRIAALGASAAVVAAVSPRSFTAARAPRRRRGSSPLIAAAHVAAGRARRARWHARRCGVGECGGRGARAGLVAGSSDSGSTSASPSRCRPRHSSPASAPLSTSTCGRR